MTLRTILAACTMLVSGISQVPGAVAQAATQLDSGSVVLTSGNAEISVPPDRAIIRLSVDSRAPTAAAASSANATRTRSLVDALDAMRQPEESVQVVGVSVRPNENYQTGALRDYEASSEVRVAIRNLTRLARIMDVAFASGATSLSDVAFRSDSEQVAERTALARAFTEARANADAIARAAGATLGPLVRASVTPEPQERGYALEMSAVTIPGGVPIAPRDVAVRATVYTTWRLRPAP